MNIEYSQFYRGTWQQGYGQCVGTETAIGSKENIVIALYTDTEKTSSDRHSTFIG